jgi:uncharacterized membrane protein
MLATLPMLVCLGAALVGGVFFAFSTFVMKSLADLPPAHGVAAMQRINVRVMQPLFLGALVGTAVLAGICIVAGFTAWGAARSTLLFTAGGCYLAGAFGVTVLFNVPRNERLAALEPESDAAAAYWPVYLREWLLWNHVRTLASLVAAGAAALVMLA